jgi:hypothetical protein
VPCESTDLLLAKQEVDGSNPFARSIRLAAFGGSLMAGQKIARSKRALLRASKGSFNELAILIRSSEGHRIQKNVHKQSR